jgi:hypothetical protein
VFVSFQNTERWIRSREREREREQCQNRHLIDYITAIHKAVRARVSLTYTNPIPARHADIRQRWSGADNRCSHDSSPPALLYHHLVGLNTVQRSQTRLFHHEQLGLCVRDSITAFMIYLLSLYKDPILLNKHNSSCCNNWLQFHGAGPTMFTQLVKRYRAFMKLERST